MQVLILKPVLYVELELNKFSDSSYKPKIICKPRSTWEALTFYGLDIDQNLI